MNRIDFDPYFTIEILLVSGVLLAYGIFSGHVSVFTLENTSVIDILSKNDSLVEIKKYDKITSRTDFNNTQVLSNGQTTLNIEQSRSHNQGLSMNTTESFKSKLPDLNHTKTLRIGAIGDIGCNTEQYALFQIFKDYQVDLYLIDGDLFYKGTFGCVQEMLKKFGINRQNTEIAIGDHDISFINWIKNFTGEPKTYFEHNHDATVSVVVMNSNISGVSLSPNSTQYNFVKDEIEGNDLDHTIVMVHQGFQTAKTKHRANGFFNDYHPIFKSNGVDVIIQANNHNFQHFDIDGILYLTVGTGTHDQPPTLYRIKSQNDGLGHNATKTIDDKNGVVIMDLDKFDHSIKGYFVGLNNTLLYSFTN